MVENFHKPIPEGWAKALLNEIIKEDLILKSRYVKNPEQDGILRMSLTDMIPGLL